VDTTPLPDSIPKVQEVGASSAPLMSASFFIGARCQAYNARSRDAQPACTYTRESEEARRSYLRDIGETGSLF
jgi:hypothetical protein